MTDNEFHELLTLVKDNNKMLKDIWTILHSDSPNNDFKDFMTNVLANQVARARF